MAKFIVVSRQSNGVFAAKSIDADTHDLAARQADGDAIHVYPDLGEMVIMHGVGESRFYDDDLGVTRRLEVAR